MRLQGAGPLGRVVIHDAGGLREAFYDIGNMMVGDMELVLNGLVPQSCKRADPTTASRLRSKPVSAPKEAQEHRSACPALVLRRR